MNRLKTRLEDRILSDKAVHLEVASGLVSTDSKTNLDRDKEEVDRVKIHLEIYSMNSKKCLEGKEVKREALPTNNKSKGRT
jgi:hypothetical protein